MEPSASVRQLVIRAPESLVLEAMTKSANDGTLANVVLGWVADKKAAIVSEVSGLRGESEKVMLRSGRPFKNAVEYTQDLDQGLVIPIGWEEVFIGTSLAASIKGSGSAQIPFQAEWQTSFSPRGELPVTWPAWWPTIPKPKVNWFEKHDFYREKVVTSADFGSGSTAILGVMRRPDHLGSKATDEGTLDLVLAQITSGAKAATAVQRSRFTVLGFGMKDSEVLDLLDRRDLDQDKTLLDRLLAKVAGGQVKLRLYCGLNQKSGTRSSLESVREHSYPCEMHTIPSSWATQPVGTLLETDYTIPSTMTLSLEHHPALPRRAEWICALDMPNLIMWLPQFFKQQVVTSLSFSESGVAVLGAMRTPDCIAGENELIAGETLLLFAKLDDTPPNPVQLISDPFGPAEEGGFHEPPQPRIELEAVVFEVLAKEEAAWQPDPNTLDDKDRFSTMLARVNGGTAKLAAHLAVASRSGPWSNISTVEEVMTVTEIDPPEVVSPLRYRPTATEVIPCGTAWEVDPILRVSSNPFDHGSEELHIRHKLQHHVARPVEPTCRQIIDSTRANNFDDIPRAIVFQETWEGEVTFRPGTVHCLGAQHPPGDAHKDKLHVAFLRARVAK